MPNRPRGGVSHGLFLDDDEQVISAVVRRTAYSVCNQDDEPRFDVAFQLAGRNEPLIVHGCEMADGRPTVCTLLTGGQALLPERALSFASKTAFSLTPRNVQMPMSSSTSGQDIWSPASPIRQVARAVTAAFARCDDQAVGIAKRRPSSRSTEMKASVRHGHRDDDR